MPFCNILAGFPESDRIVRFVRFSGPFGLGERPSSPGRGCTLSKEAATGGRRCCGSEKVCRTLESGGRELGQHGIHQGMRLAPGQQHVRARGLGRVKQFGANMRTEDDETGLIP